MEEEGEGKKWQTAERGENDVHDDKTEDCNGLELEQTF